MLTMASVEAPNPKAKQDSRVPIRPMLKNSRFRGISPLHVPRSVKNTWLTIELVNYLPAFWGDKNVFNSYPSGASSTPPHK